MGTYSSIQARVNRRVIDLPSQVVAEVPQLVNEALIELQQNHNFKVMEAELPLFTQSQQRTLLNGVLGTPVTVSPVTYKEARDDPWFTRFTDGSIRFMGLAPSRYSVWGTFNNAGPTTQTTTLDQGFPQAILEELGDAGNNRGFSVYPLPDGLSDWADGEYRITLPYWAYLPALVNPGDSNWFTTQSSGERFIVMWATAEAFSLNWDFEKEQLWKAKAEVERKYLMNADKRYRLGAVNEMAVHWRGQHNTRTRL